MTDPLPGSPGYRRTKMNKGKVPPASPPPKAPASKRTLVLSLLALGAGAVTIYSVAGGETSDNLSSGKTSATVVNSPDECAGLNIAPKADCTASFNLARASHEANAPRYPAQDECEKTYGAGRCAPHSSATGIFIPVMAGILMGRLASGGFQTAPLYRKPGDPEGQFQLSSSFATLGASQPSTSSSSSGSRSGSSYGTWSSSSTTSGTSSTRSGTSGVAVTSRGGFGSSASHFSGSSSS